METTYLFKEKKTDGSEGLRIGTRKEYEKAIQDGKTQPEGKRRYFIREKSLDPHKPDLLIIEVDRDAYRKWNRENIARCRNLKAARQIKKVSLTAAEQELDHNRIYERALCREDPMFEAVCTRMLFEALCEYLRDWRPWALDMLAIYLDEGANVCAMRFADRYGVSVQTARKYIRQFEQRIRTFLEGVSL